MKVVSALLCTFSLFLPIVAQPVYSVENSSIFSDISDDKLSISKDEFSLLKQERIGNLRIGLSEAKVKQTINCAVKREADQFWGADGAYHQKWKYVDCGITLSMVSEKKGGPKSIESITLKSPSRLSTKRGIRIGSSEKVAMKAYKAEWERESAKPGFFVAGSVYGGLIFQVENGKVSQIFLGAAAE
jgi:hypothetical protein